MKSIIWLFSILIFLFIGCSKNNPIEPIVQSDAELRANIIGVWSNQYSINYYYADGTFQDTTYEFLPDNKTITEVINGRYEIEDGILSYTISDWKFLNDLVNITPFLISLPKYKLQMTKEVLYYYPLDILTRIRDDSGDIWGSWSTSQWTISYNPNKQNQLFLGELNWQYNFNQDSMTVTYSTNFPANSDSVYHYTTEKVSYNPPNLSWDPYYNKTIEFHNNQMYMFQKLEKQPTPLKKIK